MVGVDFQGMGSVDPMKFGQSWLILNYAAGAADSAAIAVGIHALNFLRVSPESLKPELTHGFLPTRHS